MSGFQLSIDGLLHLIIFSYMSMGFDANRHPTTDAARDRTTDGRGRKTVITTGIARVARGVRGARRPHTTAQKRTSNSSLSAPRNCLGRLNLPRSQVLIPSSWVGHKGLQKQSRTENELISFNKNASPKVES